MAQGRRSWLPGSPSAPRNDAGSAALGETDFAAVFAAADFAGDGSPILLAVSGGPDSTALMHAAAEWLPRPPVLVATVDHGLRPASRREAEGVASQAAALGLPHAILSWDQRPARVSQDAARRARYGLLAAHAEAVGAGLLATAHTFDDQVETILMRLAAGSGLSGLSGMAPRVRRGGLLHLRPFLHLRKAALVATCRARGWPFVEDPTNHDPRYARPRWRALADTLAAEGLSPERIACLGERMRRADAALETVADRLAVEAIEVVEEGARSHPPSTEWWGGPSRSEAEDRGGGLHRPTTGRESASTSPHPGSLLRSDSALPTASGGRAVRVDAARLLHEPEEIGLRILIQALERAGAETIRLDRVEAAFAALFAAGRAGKALRRTLAGRLLALDRDGILVIRPEPPRFRGR